MWLLTAIGPVNGQNSFTFALEQKKEYILGRQEGCDIRYEDRYVKPVQGKIIVGDWDPSEPKKPPELRWKSEPSKKGTFPAFRTIVPMDDELAHPKDRGRYEEHDLPEGTQGCYLHDNEGQGMELSEVSWFYMTWQPLSICYDKMKDVEANIQAASRRYCVSWAPSIDAEKEPPNVVLSSALKNSSECNYAVCLGVRILLPSYLPALAFRFSACWKKVADSEDSFRLPDEGDPALQPPLDSALHSLRKDLESWLPDRSRKSMFKGWKILGLRGKVPPTEKRWLMLMGADYSEIDVVTRPLSSAKDFVSRISDWLKHVDEQGSRSRSLLVYFIKVKDELAKVGMDWTSVVGAPSQQLGIIVAQGQICWGAVRAGSVLGYVEQKGPPKPPGADIARQRMPPPPLTQASVNPPTSQAAPPSTLQSVRADFVPSTYPDESEGARRAPPAAQAEGSNSVTEADTAMASGIKKPLRRRAPKKFDLFGDDTHTYDLPPLASEVVQRAQDPPEETQRTQTQSQSQSQAASSSRLKRRAGTETQRSQFNFDVDLEYEAKIKEEEKAAEIRELYEQTKQEQRDAAGPSKRQRPYSPPSREDSESVAEELGADLPQRRQGADVEMDGLDTMDENPFKRTLRQIERARAQQAMPPARRDAHRSRNASEEGEPVEDVSRHVKFAPASTAKKMVKAEPTNPRKAATTADTDSTQNDPTKDEAFLQAITKASRSKKDIDELDKEFNDLRIPKPSKKPAKSAPPSLLPDRPDWNLVDQFEDDLRGNFIQIIRKDLFRKDLSALETRPPPVIDDGRPNFKKFKKKYVARRDPVPLVLAAPRLEDAEMGEPYWPTQAPNPYKRPQASQFPATIADDEDEMPLLPRTKKRLLGVRDDSPSTADDPTPHATRRSEKPEISQSQTGQITLSPMQRKTRRGSVASEASSVAASTRSKASTSKPKSATRGKSKKKAEVEPIVLEDSEEEVALEMDKTPTTATRSATRGATSAVDDEPMSTRSGRKASGRTTQAATGGRRKLLPADDDGDEMVFKGPAKKRRL